MSQSRKRAVFLDRDGVLNRAIIQDGKPYPPRRPEDFEIFDEARAACAILKSAGFQLVCVTNQPDVGRGVSSAKSVQKLNDILMMELPLDDLRVCMHDDAAGCYCRKPKPGLLEAAADQLHLDLATSFMVGDRWRDIEAGRAAGCRTVLIDHHYAERRPEKPDFTTESIAAAAKWIISQTRVRRGSLI
jgi:D-glycero-D-manno-heptose 1,7-bisphosphate phosphatase